MAMGHLLAIASLSFALTACGRDSAPSASETSNPDQSLTEELGSGGDEAYAREVLSGLRLPATAAEKEAYAEKWKNDILRCYRGLYPGQTFKDEEIRGRYAVYGPDLTCSDVVTILGQNANAVLALHVMRILKGTSDTAAFAKAPLLKKGRMPQNSEERATMTAAANNGVNHCFRWIFSTDEISPRWYGDELKFENLGIADPGAGCIDLAKMAHDYAE